MAIQAAADQPGRARHRHFRTDEYRGDLPKYEHDDLYACFHDLDEKIRYLLETVVPSNFRSLPLKLLSPSIYGTSLADDKYLRNTRMYLAVNAEMNEAELIGKTPYLIKLCSANHIEVLVKQVLPGVALTHTQKPPSAIPVKVNYQYFSLNQIGGAWEAIVRARNLAAYVPGDFPAPKMELVILLPEAWVGQAVSPARLTWTNSRRNRPACPSGGSRPRRIS